MAAMRSASKPRRFRPSLLMPRGRPTASPATIVKGGTSPLSSTPMPMKACAPTRQNWCTPAKPLMITQSSMVTWPASVELLENTQ